MPGKKATQRGTDHPHAGGENRLSSKSAGVLNGPSPRGWGELQFAARHSRSHRTIPTRVGRTHFTMKAVIPYADHPHAGGENQFPSTFPERIYGPSPRGWGEHLQRENTERVER